MSCVAAGFGKVRSGGRGDDWFAEVRLVQVRRCVFRRSGSVRAWPGMARIVKAVEAWIGKPSCGLLSFG